MTDFSSYPTLIQPAQTEYVNSETMDGTSNQMTNNSNNNIIYNSAPLIVLNSQKSDMALLHNSMMNDGQTYVTIQTQSNTGATDMNGAKILNTPIIIQSSQSIPLQSSQYQQQQSLSTMNVQQNGTQMTSLTPSQLQSLSYLMQTQMAPQFIQTANGLIQIIPQGFFASPHQQSNQGHDQQLQAQISGLPTIGWSIGNFNTNSNPITLDNQLQPIQLNNISLPQLIPVQHVIQSNNSFFANQNDDQDQMVSTIIDLNANDKKGPNNRKPSRRKRKQTTKLANNNYSSQLSSPLAHPTSTNEVTKEIAESSSGKMISGNNIGESITLYDNKGRPFSFVCPDCPKKFTLNSRLSAHMRCHTGMRPFTCTVCGFSFTQKSYLIRHAAVHKEERPFHCEKCQKSYKHYGSLANHRKLHRKDEKSDTEIHGDRLKLEPTASDNGRSSSISSLVINNCSDFSSLIPINGYQEANSAMLPCHKEEQQHEQDNETVNDGNNTFTITSTTTTDLSNTESYIKQLELMYPMSLTSTTSDNIADHCKSTNVFFQEQSIQNQEMDGNYVEEEEEEDNDDDCGEEEDEEDSEMDALDPQTVDMSMADKYARSNNASLNSEYQN